MTTFPTIDFSLLYPERAHMKQQSSYTSRPGSTIPYQSSKPASSNNTYPAANGNGRSSSHPPGTVNSRASTGSSWASSRPAPSSRTNGQPMRFAGYQASSGQRQSSVGYTSPVMMNTRNDGNTGGTTEDETSDASCNCGDCVDCLREVCCSGMCLRGLTSGLAL
jgi:hypothetical protein